MQTAPFNLEQASIEGCTLGEVLGAFSHALDLAGGHEPGHCLRCCFIGTRIGGALGLGPDEISDLHYTLLLKDLGRSQTAAPIGGRPPADGPPSEDGSGTRDRPAGPVIAFVPQNTASDASPIRRAGLRGGNGLPTDLSEARSRAGADIARQMRFSDAVAEGIAGLDEHWDGGGRPHRLTGATIPLVSRIALLSQAMEVSFRAAGPDAALREIAQRAGTSFDPEIVGAARACAGEAGFWEALAAPDIDARVRAMQPPRYLDEDLLDDILRAFARVIDATSPFAHGHSERVALYARLLAEDLSLGPVTRRWMWRTGLMHDIGKLGVSTLILDKTEPLTPGEFAMIKRHPVRSQTILGRVAAFRPMARIAAAHHERLDGRGYPYGLSGAELTREMRILTIADIFDALSAARPYKPALPLWKVRAIMESMSGTAIDGDILQALWAIVEGGRTSAPP